MNQPEIRDFAGKLLTGVRRRMSFVNDRTSEIWREFRTREGGIKGRIGNESYSVKVYDAGYSFANFDPAAEFNKWAAAEVNEPAGEFETLWIPAGTYAVFIHKGSAAEAPRSFGYIFGEWLPHSGFELDHRLHFEVLPAGYNPFDPEAEEEIWIPVQGKGLI
jgi:AraC family transcriptional regulator